MNETKETRLDRLLDLLAEEVAERLRAEPQKEMTAVERTDIAAERAERAPVEERTPDLPETGQVPQPVAEPHTAAAPETEAEEMEADGEPKPAAAPPTSHTARLLGRLALALLALVIVINIPINRHGTTLATAMPDTRALVIRDGLVVKEADDAEIYVYQDKQFRWISSLRAFEMQGYTWEDVHVVEDGFLDPYEIGPPIHVILKCPDSPHIYLLEGEEKRWIVDIAAFEAQGYVWEDVAFVSCAYLRSLPDGETIPPEHGPPPQP
jgi:hypothetical protein